MNTPVGYGDDGDSTVYNVGIINPRESYIKSGGTWMDYSDESARDRFFAITYIQTPTFDNFPIKGFCKATGKDIIIEFNGSTSIALFRGEEYTMDLRFVGNSEDLPQNPDVTWSLTEGGNALVDMTVHEGGASVTLKPKEEGNTNIVVTVEGVGTKIFPLPLESCLSSISCLWTDTATTGHTSRYTQASH